MVSSTQHANPKSDIDIARVAEKRPILEIGKERLGIAPEHLDRIFEAFYTTRGDKGGTGLGLAVSYRIIERHQGMLTVESVPGEGATFIIRLPLPEGEGT